MKRFFTLSFAVLLFTSPALSAEPVQDSGEPPAAVDADYDGVADAHDKCLNTPLVKKIAPDHKFAALFPPERRSPEPKSVPVDADGCALDTDKDGVADYQDFCPEDSELAISAGVHSNGCPLQSDSDGTPDYRDQCPGTALGVPTDKFGCPKN